MFVSVVAALNVVVGTALGAVMAMLYNFSRPDHRRIAGRLPEQLTNEARLPALGRSRTVG